MEKLKAYWVCGRNVNQFTATVYRKDFFLDEKCDSGILKVTATNRFQFFVNGETVAFGPKRTHAGYKEYDTVDISRLLKVGRNSFAVTIIYSPSCRMDTRDGLIAEADIVCGNKAKIVITDSSWVFAPADWYGTRQLFCASGTELQEHFDSRKMPLNWQTEEYPLVPEKAETTYLPDNFYKNADCGMYQPVTVLGPYYTTPFIDVTERTTPIEQLIDYNPKCVFIGSAGSEVWNIDDNLAIKFNAEEKIGKEVELKEEIYNSGSNNLFIFDFQKTRFVRPGISVKALKGDVRIELYYWIGAKNAHNANGADRVFGGPKEGFCDTFVPTENNFNWQAVAAKGFRFMSVRIVGEGEVDFAPYCQLVEYPFGEQIKPKTDSDILNRAFDIGAETIRSATTDYYVDTCWRENALWTYDACVTGRAGYDTFGETKMWKNTMLGVARSVSNFGVHYSMAIPFAHLLIDQNLIWTYYCLDFYSLTKDIDFLKQVYAPITKILDYCEKMVTSENLFIPPMGNWHYIDWAKIQKEPYSLPINALYILANDAASKIAEILGDTKRKNVFLKQAQSVRTACNRFYDESEGAFLCHIEPKIFIGEYNKFSFIEDDGSDTFRHNIYANCLAIRAGIGDDKMRQSAADYVAERLTEEYKDWHDIAAGAFDWLLSPLINYGKGREVKAHLEGYLKIAIDKEFPTFGESKNSVTGKYNSAHGWGSNVNSLIVKLLKAGV